MMDHSAFNTATREDTRLRIDLVHPPAMYYALVHNNVPIVRYIRVANISESDINNVAVTLDLDATGSSLAKTWSAQIPRIPAGMAIGWDDFSGFSPDPSVLKHADEAFTVTYRLIVQDDLGHEIRVSAPSRVLAHNEWLNSPVLYESIASFVQPNTDSVGRMLRRASQLLQDSTGSNSLQGYQAGSKRAAQIAAALYETLRENKIAYVSMPASFEEAGQKVRPTSTVLSDHLGNCIDLSVTYAALLEAAGLHPLIWITEGHAFSGFFLNEERLPETVSLDPAQMINVVESDKAVAVELTATGPGDGSASFSEAVRLGRAHLRGAQRLRGMIDIHLAHRSGIRPLPSTDRAHVQASDPTPITPRPAALSLPPELEAGGAFDEEENLETQAADDGAPARVLAWRRALLDLSLRNPLLKLPKRGKGLELHVPVGSLAELDNLVHSGKPIHVVAQDTVGGVHELQGVRRAQDLPNESVAEELQKDRRIYGSVTESGYVAKMRGLQREARTMQQETGSNYLYLTLGSLVHSTASGEAHAPLFLVPVRIEGGAGRKPYTIVVDGDELAAPNYCLVQWLRVKHGMQIKQLQDPPIDESGIDIVEAFRTIKKALADNNVGYRIDETASLRLLQFSTFQMWRDLSTHWETFSSNAVVRHLVENSGRPMLDAAPLGSRTVNESAMSLPIAADGSQMRAIAMAEQGASFVLEGPPGTGKSQSITNLIAHAVQSGKTVLFVAEKQAALDVVKRRLAAIGLENFCLDLHGRRQTVKNIRQQLKNALEHLPNEDAHGWTALQANYRAKVATLAAYPQRLHAENAAGFSAWSAYQALLAHGEGASAPVPASYFALANEQRTAAENAARELPAAARSAQVRAGHPWSISRRRSVEGLSPEVVVRTAQELEDVRTQFAQLPDVLRGRIAELPGPTELGAALNAAELAVAGRLPDRLRTSAAMAVGWDDAATAAYDATNEFHRQHRATLSTFQPDFFVTPEFDRLAAQAEAAGKGLFGKKKRRTRLAEALGRHLHPGVQLDQDTVLPAFRAAVDARSAAATVGDRVMAVPALGLPVGWWPTQSEATQAIQSTYEDLRVARELLHRRPDLWNALSALGAQAPAAMLHRFVDVWTRWLEILGTTGAEFTRWAGADGWVVSWQRDGARWTTELAAGQLRSLQRWGAVLAHTDVLAQAGLQEFASQIIVGEMAPDDIEVAFLRGVTSAALDERLRNGELDYFDAGAHEQQVVDYLRLGEEIREQLPEHLASDIVAKRPRKAGRHANPAGELIRRLNSRNDRLSFRAAVVEYGETVTQLTPCFLMSPASVANFLEPGAITFDILVFDEASQIRVAQAIGSMGRAKSVIVVGDSKQMPPTNVMEAAHSDTEEDLTIPEDLDSILAECVESGLPRESLTWHYRSTDESLISFSNSHYYDDKLASLPSPGGDPTTGIFWRRVDGQFDRGSRASRTNAVEAAAVVEEVSALLADPRTADRSLGVVTFNIQQRDLLLNLLEESADARIQAALSREDSEALFVKNLENVQGDERDVILFSLAFSKNPETGLLPLNFGPLSTQGGERRLNVAVTRARSQIVLFSSFDPKDIDLTRTSALGTQHLRAYLEQATAQAVGPDKLGKRVDRNANRVVEEIAGELRKRGHEVQTHFGLSHFTVDLAVRAAGSGRWQVAVMLDGPTWAHRSTVADRDGAPQLLRTVMRWPSVVRVWLPQWITDRTSVLERIDAAVESARVSPEVEQEPAHEPVQPDWPVADEAPIAEVLPAEPVLALQGAVSPSATPVVADMPPAFVPYQPTTIGNREQIDNLAHNGETQRLVRESMDVVIAAEGPIPLDRLLRLVHRRFGLERMSAARRDSMATYLPSRYRLTVGGNMRFAWPDHLDPDTWRGFRQTRLSTDRLFEEICPEEIANAMLYAVETTQANDVDQLQRATMTLLGYRRRTTGLEAALSRVQTWAVAEGRLPGCLGANSARAGEY